MAASAENFNNHVKERWGNDTKVLLTADNLDAHVYEETKRLLAKDERVFVLYFPPNCTEAIHPIDAGYGRSICCCIGRCLDAWLMEANHLELWEKGMAASERRVLVSKFAAQANEEVIKKDDSRVSCFSCCGIMLTLDGTGDELIKPQGCTKLPLKIPEYIDQSLSNDFDDPVDVVSPETIEFGLSEEDTAIHVGDEEEDIRDGVLVAEEEVDDEDEDEVSETQITSTHDSDSEDVSSNNESEEEHVEIGISDENELIKESTRGRRTIRRTRLYCHEYW